MSYTGGTCQRCGCYFERDLQRQLRDHTMRDCLRVLDIRRRRAVDIVVSELDDIDAREADITYQLRLEEAEARA